MRRPTRCLSHRWDRRPRTGRSPHRGGGRPGQVAWRHYRTTRPLRCADSYPAAFSPGREIDHRGTQRIAAEHYAGVRRTTGHELNVGAQIVGAADNGYVGGVVDSIHADRQATSWSARKRRTHRRLRRRRVVPIGRGRKPLRHGACRRCRRNQRRCRKGHRCRGNHQYRGKCGEKARLRTREGMVSSQ